jgi:DNA polymerase-1
LPETCLIVDSFSLVYRAFFGFPTSIKRQDGQIINAVLGFYNTISSLLEQFQPSYFIVAADHPEPTFRHLLYSDYKAQRPPMPEELRSQLPLIRELIDSLAAPVVQVAGYEADDVIGTLSRLTPDGVHCYIVSNDKDTLQLVTDDVTVISLNTKANKMYTPELVTYEMGVAPQQIPELKALMGDASDNIPGIPLVGPKTALKWLHTYGSLQGILANVHLLRGKAGQNLAERQEEVLLYRDLATINCRVPTLCCWRAGRVQFDENRLRATLDSLGIRASVPRVS